MNLKRATDKYQQLYSKFTISFEGIEIRNGDTLSRVEHCIPDRDEDMEVGEMSIQRSRSIELGRIKLFRVLFSM